MKLFYTSAPFAAAFSNSQRGCSRTDADSLVTRSASLIAGVSLINHPEKGPMSVRTRHPEHNSPAFLEDLIRQQNMLRAGMYVAIAALQNARAQGHAAAG